MSTTLDSAILRFHGVYRFLSNFYTCPVRHDGLDYPSSEHAYQAAKTDDLEMRRRVARLRTASSAKSFGRTVVMSVGFEANKTMTMWSIVYKKFAQNPVLKEKLLDTGNLFLVEGNTWGDEFCGVCEGRGRNHLGHILMKVREELRG